MKDSVYRYEEDAANLEPGKFYAYTFRLVSSAGMHSGFSDTVAVRVDKPVPLDPPANLAVSLNGTQVHLYWPEITGNQVHVLGYHLWRKGAKDREYKMLVDSLLPVELGAFTDTTVITGQEYQYAISSYGGNSEESAKQPSALIKVPEIPIAAPAGIEVYGNSEGAVVSWSPVAQKDIKSYKLYRYQRGVAPKLIGTVPANEECKLVDKQLKSKQLYFYYVISESTDGRMSGRGPETSYYQK
jgi:fibronectin type 3 domain-containing protein